MTDPDAEFAETPKTGIDRRHFIAYGLGGAVAVAALGFAGVDLVSRGVLPGQQLLFRIEGRCTVPVVDLRYVSPLGPTVRGTFYSHARNRMVGYWIGYPPGHGPGDELPLIVMLHGYGGNHTNALVGMSPSQAMALRVGSNPLPPMAIVTVDGGGGY